MKIEEERIEFAATDLSNFLACRHLTRLELAALHGLTKKPQHKDAGFDALAKRGGEHEQRVLEEFRGKGWDVVEVTHPFTDLEAALSETKAALADNADAIYQAALRVDDRIGYPDFLLRAELLPDGGAGYEVVDAKLARSAKARAVLQATFYSRLLAETTGTKPERLHLALGTGDLTSFRVADYAAYERQVDRMLREYAAEEPTFPIADPYPDPVEHCAICRWAPVCKARRREDDDLSLIAGISSRQRKALKAADISTRRGFAGRDEPPKLDGVTREGMERVHAQARIQVRGEDEGKPLHELVEPERDPESQELVPDRGLLALPPPAEGDLFFDIEGARFYSEDTKEFGLQYLFGIVDTSEPDDPYRSWWAFDRAGEKRAFEELMDFLADHLDRYPDANIYHYNHYEPVAIEHLSENHEAREDVLRRLMGRFGTREDDVDHILRRKVFVDLYRVVRQGIRASVESYSIKSLEKNIGYVREQNLQELNERIIEFDIALDEHTAEADKETREIVRAYNEDDCRATLALRDWLEARRRDLEEHLSQTLPRPQLEEESERKTDPEVEALRSKLSDGLPEDEADWDDHQRARAILAELLLFHSREGKPRWWRYFHLLGLNDEQLIEERDAIGGLSYLGDGDASVLGPRARSRLMIYAFPEQEHKFEAGDSVKDPISEKSLTVHEVNELEGTITLKRARNRDDEPHPSAVIEPNKDPSPEKMQESLRTLAHRVLELGDSEWPSEAALDLLLRRRPAIGGAGILPFDGTRESARDLALALEASCLPIQGPPGTGKTHTGAYQIAGLVEAGKKVGVTAMPML